MRIEFIGLDKLIDLFIRAGDKALPSLKQAMAEETQIMFRDSQRLVPVDTGTLRRSGILETPVERNNNIEVIIGYGGAASAYALKQHEDLSYRHKEGQTAKYLENPVRERVPSFQNNIRSRIERILKERQ
jgi:hypothetical protein